MLEAFEARLFDVLSDLLAGAAGVAVLRTFEGVLPQANAVQVAGRLVRAEPDPRFGDDVRDRIGPRPELRARTTLHLVGEVLVSCRIRTTGGGLSAPERRRRLLVAMDRVLAQLAATDLRRGTAFQRPTDQGFELDGFRLLALAEPDAAAGELDLRYEFSGRFWPVASESAGPAIVRIPVQIALLPVELPRGLVARQGSQLAVPIRIDLRQLEALAPGQIASGGAGRLEARLRGASAPGQLTGGTATGSAAIRVYGPSGPGVFTLGYQAPLMVVARAEAQIELGLQRDVGEAIPLGVLVVEVVP